MEQTTGGEDALANETLGVQSLVRDSHLPYNPLYQPSEHRRRGWAFMRSKGSRSGLRESWSQTHKGTTAESTGSFATSGLRRGLRALLFRAPVPYVVCNPQGIRRWL
jgi:hypothetical protein